MAETQQEPQNINSESAAVHEALNRNLSLAETVPVVQNGFITKEQVAYCLGWKDLVNPNSEPQAVLYNAIGPDVGTVLLSTNATSVYGVDAQPPSIDRTRHFLSEWDKVDTDVVSLPPKDNSYIDRYHNEGIKIPTPESAARELQKTLRLRAERGFWDVGEMITWSIDRCLIIELKKLGINQSDIQVNSADGQIQLDFPWAYPGEEPKLRRVTYIKGMTYDIIDNPEKYNLPQLDGYYEKSVEAGRWAGMNKNDLQDMKKFIKPEGYALIGRGLGDDAEERKLEEANMAALGTEFKPLSIDKGYKEIVHQRLQDERASKYGWDLYGARKIAA